MIRPLNVPKLVGVGCVVLFAAKARAANVCDTVTAHRNDTVILFSAPSTFTICYEGSEEPDVVTGRRVYLQLVSTPGSGMFRFRVHGQEAEPKLTGLSALRTDTMTLAVALDELAHSAEHISSVSFATDGTQVGAARARYLGVVTPTYSDALGRSRRSIANLPVVARTAHDWCSELHATAGTCTAGEPVDDVTKEVARFQAAASEFDAARDLARAAVIRAAARLDDAALASDAAKMLDLARGTADTVVASARRLSKTANDLVTEIAAVRREISSIGALHANVPTYLATYGDAANATLRIDATPVGVDESPRASDDNEVSFRFPIIGRHYFDVEVGAGITGGVPQLLSIGTIGNQTVIQGKDVDAGVALALAELEPFRFGWPDKPLAGVVRFPVIGIPLSRDPTQNFFVGGGLGWTGVGSIVAGPYLLREATLLSNFQVGEVVPTNTTLNTVSTPKTNVGFFVSASIDLVGLYHLFFAEHLPSIDAASAR